MLKQTKKNQRVHYQEVAFDSLIKLNIEKKYAKQGSCVRSCETILYEERNTGQYFYL